MKTKTELAKEWLDNNKVFSGEMNKTQEAMVEILGEEVPSSMARVMAVFTMASFLAHLHLKIEIDKEENNYVPASVIGFVLAKSGAKKTSSIKVLRNCLSSGIDKIEEIRDRMLELKEQTTGVKQKKRPLNMTISTNPGLVAMYNAFARDGLGSPSLIVDEIATELKTNAKELTPNIQMAAQMFDDGDYMPKIIKDEERQEDEIKGMIMNALFIGSEYTILTNEKVLELFMDEFISKLSRRVLFARPIFNHIPKEFKTIEEVDREEAEREQKVKELRNEIRDKSLRIVEEFIRKDKRYVTISDEARAIWKNYARYNQGYFAEGQEIDEDKATPAEHTVLERVNRDWKMLKIAGVFAAFAERKSIEKQDVIEAISLVESLDGDLESFMALAEQTPAEKVVSVLNSGIKTLTFNELIKAKWIKRPEDVEGLVTLVNGLYTGGVVEIVGTAIKVKEFQKVEKIGISYKPVPGVKDVMEQMNVSKKEAKEIIAKKFAVENFKYVQTEFKNFADLLSNDCAYIPFRLKDNYRRNDNVIGTSQILILDIDTGDIMDTEAHDLLLDYNHMIARGSDPDNPFKFRVLMPVDVEIDVEEEWWTNIYRLVQEDLGLEIDLVGKTQFFFGYKDRKVLTTFDGENYPISKILPKVKGVETPKKKIIYKATEAQERAMWEHRAERYPETFNAEHGEEMKLFTMMESLMDAGISEEMNKKICDDAIEQMPGAPRRGFAQNLNNQRRRKYAKKYKSQESVID